MSFRNLELQEVLPSKTVPLVLNQLVGPVDKVLHVMHLGESNAEFWNDALAKANTRAVAAAMQRRQALTPQMIDEARAKNRETVARYAVKNIEGFSHDDGRPATLDDVPAIVRSLPTGVFDSVLAFVSNEENFRERPILGDAKDIAGK